MNLVNVRTTNVLHRIFETTVTASELVRPDRNVITMTKTSDLIISLLFFFCLTISAVNIELY